MRSYAVGLFPSVCSFVICMSVTLVDCIKMAEDIVKVLSHPRSPIILFFISEHQYRIPREPLQEGCKIHRVG